MLIVDDDANLVALLAFELGEEGLETAVAGTGAEALRRLVDVAPHALLLDLQLPDIHGRELLQRVRVSHPALPIVVLTAEGAVDQVVECMRLGAADFIQKPFERTRLVTSVRNALTQGALRARVESLTDELRSGQGLESMLGRSPAIRRSVDLLGRAAKLDVTVLIEGESGTGKEVAARAVHAESTRRSGPFVAVNCGAIPEALIESELFGHEKGAFTGATSARPGRFEQAHGGTLFLDEIGELRIDLQVKLLRVLQERVVQRIGAATPRKVDIRVIAATNRDLKAEIARRAFREDLYYRLSVFPVKLPPLRERTGDVRLLAEVFLSLFSSRHGRTARGASPDAWRALEAYRWPGNVRELENVIERATILEDSPLLRLSSLPDEVIASIDGLELASSAAEPGGAAPSGPPERAALEASSPPSTSTGGADPAPVEGPIIPFEEEERRILLRALTATRWNVQEAAKRLGLGRATIYRKIEAYGLDAHREKPPV